MSKLGNPIGVIDTQKMAQIGNATENCCIANSSDNSTRMVKTEYEKPLNI